MGRLFWKIFFGFWLTLLVTGGAVGTAFYVYNQARLGDADDLAEGPRAATLVATTAAVLSHGGPDALEALFRELPERRRRPLLIVDDKGTDLFGRPVPPAALQRARAALGSGSAPATIRSITTPEGAHYLLFVPAQFGGHPPHLSHRNRFYMQLVIGLLASLLFSAALAWHLSRPLRLLRAASRRLAAGELDTRVMPEIGRRHDEIADLGADFDHMAARLQALLDAQKRLLHDVSHELRSPLARIQVAVGLVRQQPQRQARLLERIEREIDRLDELVGEALTLSRLEAGVSPGETGVIDLAELLEDVIDDARFEAEAIGRHVVQEGHWGTCNVVGQAELLRRAFENVVRNAVRHTAAETAVTVSMACGEQEVTVTVCDQGRGVAPEQLNTIFEPFFRTVNDTAQPVGYGLGLAIARRAIEAHRGTISPRNRAEGGLCVDIVLHRAN